MMHNRISHILKDWKPAELDRESAKRVEADPGIPKLPRGINMLMPVDLCINRDLLISLLSASIQEIYRHKRIAESPLSNAERDEMEASLQQQLVFRAWARDYPNGYISIAMYPVSEVEAVEDLEDLGELGEF